METNREESNEYIKREKRLQELEYALIKDFINLRKSNKLTQQNLADKVFFHHTMYQRLLHLSNSIRETYLHQHLPMRPCDHHTQASRRPRGHLYLHQLNPRVNLMKF